MKKYLSDYRFWIIVVSFLGLAVVHNSSLFSIYISPFIAAGLSRYTFERVLFLAVIIFTAYIFGKKAGITSTIIALVIMLPNSLFIASSQIDAIFETLGIVATGLLVTFMFDIRNRSITQLREHQKHIIDLSRQLVSAYEIERERIGQELHDSVGQSLTVLNLAINKLRKSRPDEFESALDEMEGFLGEAIRDVRDVSHLLKPPRLDDAGLFVALDDYFRLMQLRAGLSIEFTHTESAKRLSGVLEAVVFRIIQEALTNISRHAGVKDASVSISLVGNTLSLEIADKGIGFDSTGLTKDSLGLRGMRERAELLGGTLRIDSRPGTGTIIRGEFPLQPDTG